MASSSSSATTLSMKSEATLELMKDFKERTGIDLISPSSSLSSSQKVTPVEESENLINQFPIRYLWTDAFAVLNFMELYRLTNQIQYQQDAIKLIYQVHEILGKHRFKDDKLKRIGWISGLEENNGKLHPTIGGLRIGKKYPERNKNEIFNEEIEWNLDGQYFHYLTKWIHVLISIHNKLNDFQYLKWAYELMKTIHLKFIYYNSKYHKKQIYWKMSIDLSYPLVNSMGMHDGIDGLITYYEFKISYEYYCKKQKIQFNSPQNHMKEVNKETSVNKDEVFEVLDLENEIKDMKEICDVKNGSFWATSDALGIGGLLIDACKLSQIIVQFDHLKETEHQCTSKDHDDDDDDVQTTKKKNKNEVDSSKTASMMNNDDANEELLFLNAVFDRLMHSIELSLDYFAHEHHPFNTPPHHRLAFRELGLSIGLHSIPYIKINIEENLYKFINDKNLLSLIQRISRYQPMSEQIENFWLQPMNQKCQSWISHQDINAVMLATSLCPHSFLIIF